MIIPIYPRFLGQLLPNVFLTPVFIFWSSLRTSSCSTSRETTILLASFGVKTFGGFLSHDGLCQFSSIHRYSQIFPDFPWTWVKPSSEHFVGTPNWGNPLGNPVGNPHLPRPSAIDCKRSRRRWGFSIAHGSVHWEKIIPTINRQYKKV